MKSFTFWAVTLASVACLSIVYCNTVPPNSATINSITSAEIDNLKAHYLTANFVGTNFTLKDAKSLLHQKCKKAGIENMHIYDEIETSTAELLQCATKIANLTELLTEIEAARPVGELDVVFHKYCDKRPQAEQCLQNFNSHLLPCLTVEERAQNAIMMRIISSLLGFLCYKNGDPISIFIAEEGPECFEQQKENIGNCMNATFAAYLQKHGETNMLDELPEFVLSPKQCIDLYDFEECVLGYLEQCNEITPANIIDSMFEYVKNETKCDKQNDPVISGKHIRGGAACSISFNYALVVCSAVILSFFKSI